VTAPAPAPAEKNNTTMDPILEPPREEDANHVDIANRRGSRENLVNQCENRENLVNRHDRVANCAVGVRTDTAECMMKLRESGRLTCHLNKQTRTQTRWIANARGLMAKFRKTETETETETQTKTTIAMARSERGRESLHQCRCPYQCRAHSWSLRMRARRWRTAL
jgi:hypothetical protein